jgi:hypothetical protein
MASNIFFAAPTSFTRPKPQGKSIPVHLTVLTHKIQTPFHVVIAKSRLFPWAVTISKSGKEIASPPEGVRNANLSARRHVISNDF